ncbi:pyrin [Sorex araneus]|uniref:pyrin n=1 Tax=Sorex araneus TaxID=42254 RepID=UPI00243405C2|nr:pyrin [Sorex araneus]
MEEIVADNLLHSLQELLPNEFEVFKLKLQSTHLENEPPRISRSQLHDATPVQVTGLLLWHYGQIPAVLLTLKILKKMNLEQLIQKLMSALVPESLSSQQPEPSLTQTNWGPAGAKQGRPIRRIASSAGRLQNLGGSVRLREGLRSSGKERPKSLESSIPCGDKELAHWFALLAQEKRESESLDLAVAPGRGVAQRGPEPLRKGSRHPGHSKGPEGAAVRNAPPRISPPKEKPSSAPAGKSGMTGPVALGVGVSPSSGMPQERVVCPLCRTQEEGLSAHEAGGCSQCQASLLGKRGQGHEPQENPKMTSLSPKTLPPCERHRRQAQLRLCEAHREPICLICSLSLGHQGHRICPTDEAAQGYKEQIQKQLEHLKALRKFGEEQRSQGDKKAVSFLKSTEVQKQKLRCQLEGLCQFLEQQEQLFVAWLKNLAQNIEQLRGAYSTLAAKGALLEEQAGELEAAQCQPAWELTQDIGGPLHRAQSLPVPELRATPPDMKEKLHQKSELMERTMKQFSGDMTLDVEKALLKLTLSDDLRSVRGALLPARTERADACIITLCSPTSSSCHYWEVGGGRQGQAGVKVLPGLHKLER